MNTPSGEKILSTLVELLAEQHGIKVEYRIITKEEGVENEEKKNKSKTA